MDPVFAMPMCGRSDRKTGHRVLGLNLRPLTVGHLRLLLELDNAWPDSPENSTFADLAAAALVCSQPHQESAKLLYGRLARLGWRFWAWRSRKANWITERTHFAAYLESQLRRPDTDAPGTRGERRVPLAWRLIAMLMSDFRYSFKDAMDVEVGFALTLWAVESDRRGVEKLANERQIRFRAWVKEQEEQRLAKEGK